MVTRRAFLAAILGGALAALASFAGIPRLAVRPPSKGPPGAGEVRPGGVVYLPMPRLAGEVSLEEALASRRSIREYTGEPLALWEVSQVLWAAYGVNEVVHGFKTTPSAGATYPLEVYAVVAPRGVYTGSGYLEPGSYKYDPHSHTLRLARRGDLVGELYRAALEQEWVRDAPVNLVFTAVYERTTGRYGERGVRYVHIEVGHAGQNVYLQAAALGLATVAIGAFHDDRVREIIGAPPEEHPLYIMPLAKPRAPYRLDQVRLQAYIERSRQALEG